MKASAAEPFVSDPVLLDDWYPVARSDALAEGQVTSARLLDRDLVLWRTGGRAAAWRDLCIHRGARLSLGKVKAGCLACPYHGWEYDIEGQCQRFPAHPDQKPPARAAAQTYPCRESYGLIWVCLGNPAKDIPAFPEWDDPSFRKLILGPYPFNASPPRIMENALDLAHVPFVHDGSLGDSRHPEVNNYSVETTPEGIWVRNYQIYQCNADGTGAGGTVAYDVLVSRPFTLYSAKPTPSGRFTIFFTVTPIENTKSLLWFLNATNYATHIPVDDFARFQDPITAEDVVVVESQRPELLPLDLHAELHLRCDRVTVAYRQWLKALGMKYGTS